MVMKRQTLLLFSVLLVLILLSGCRPLGEAYTYQDASSIPLGFAPPWDVLKADKPTTVIGYLVAEDIDSYTLRLIANRPGGLVYKYGYIVNKTADGTGVEWYRVEFVQEAVAKPFGGGATNWIRNLGGVDVKLPKSIYGITFNNDEMYILGYTCIEAEGGYKCGCVDAATCTEKGAWQVNILKFSEGIIDVSCSNDNDCVSGTICENELCVIGSRGDGVTGQSCVDSENGVNYAVKGEVTATYTYYQYV